MLKRRACQDPRGSTGARTGPRACTPASGTRLAHCGPGPLVPASAPAAAPAADCARQVHQIFSPWARECLTRFSNDLTNGILVEQQPIATRLVKPMPCLSPPPIPVSRYHEVFTQPNAMQCSKPPFKNTQLRLSLLPSQDHLLTLTPPLLKLLLGMLSFVLFPPLDGLQLLALDLSGLLDHLRYVPVTLDALDFGPSTRLAFATPYKLRNEHSHVCEPIYQLAVVLFCLSLPGGLDTLAL